MKYRKSLNFIEKHVVGKYVSEKVELLKYNAIIGLNNKTNPLAASSLKNHMKGLVM